jgi:hypothetical protein
MPKISGVSEELLGAASDDVAGVLSMLRQGAGLVTLQGLFDRLDQSQKTAGQIILSLIQNNFMPGKIQNILGKDKPISPAFHNRLFGKYSCVVEEGMMTSTQKQMQFAQLIELRKLGVAIPDDVLLESLTMQKKSELIASVKKSQEAQSQMAQQQQQVQMQELQARAEMAHAKAGADRGLEVERVSRIEENKSLAIERKAAAKKDEEQAVLNMVRALKEIEQIDLAQLEKLILLTKSLQEPTIAGQGETPQSPVTSQPPLTQSMVENQPSQEQGLI